MKAITRRGMVGLAAAALFQVLSINVPARAGSPGTLPPGLEQLSDRMAGRIGLSAADAGKPVVTIIETPPHDQDDSLYRFLGSDGFLAAAAKANVLTLGNEIAAGDHRAFMELESAAFTKNQPQIAAARSNILHGLNMALQGSAGLTPQEIATLPELIVDYVQKAAQLNIEVSPRDTLASDPVLQALYAKQAADATEDLQLAAKFDLARDTGVQAGYTQRRAELQKDNDNLLTRITAWRSSEECNAPIAAALAADQKRFGGNMVVPYGVAHADALEKAFRQTGYAVIRIALHASATQMQADRDFAASRYHLTYSGLPFLADTMNFVGKPLGTITPRMTPPQPH